MEKNDDIFLNNLIILFKLFKDSPNYLSKYLTKNKAFDDDFINVIMNSEKLNNIRHRGEDNYFSTNHIDDINFPTIDEMEEYYQSILTTYEYEVDDEIDLNLELCELLDKELYEDAIILRDYMMRNNFDIY